MAGSSTMLMMNNNNHNKGQLLAAFLDAMPGEAYIKELSGNYIYVNRQFEMKHGILCKELSSSSSSGGMEFDDDGDGDDDDDDDGGGDGANIFSSNNSNSNSNSNIITDASLYTEEIVQQKALEDEQVIETGKSMHCQRVAGVDCNRSIVTKFPIFDDEGTMIAIGGLVVRGGGGGGASGGGTNHTHHHHSNNNKNNNNNNNKNNSNNNSKNKSWSSSPHNLVPQQVVETTVRLSANLPLPSSSSSPPPPSTNRRRLKRRTSSSMTDEDDEEKSSSSSPSAAGGCWDDILEPGQNYRRLFKNMQMGAALNEVVTDEDNNPIDFIFREINPAFEKMTGLKESEVIGRRATEVLPGILDDPSDWVRKFGQVALDGVTYKYDRQYSKSLKKWYGGMTYRPGGQKGLFVSLFLDVTDSVRAEEALRESEERHRNLFESMMQGVVYQEASGNIIAANPSAERILGMTIDQMMGRTSVDPRWKSIREDGSDFPGDQHPSMIALKTGKPETGVFMGVFHPSTEKHHWIIIDAIPRFRPGESTPFQVYATFTDMTQTKEFERRLLREKDRAEMADRLKSAFLANMSHEIRTPLNGIIGHIDLALSNGLSESVKRENLDGLKVARQSGELLITIIQDILDLSKIEAGEMAIENDGNFKLRTLVDQVTSLGQTMISQRNKDISFESHVQDGIEDRIRGDVFRLQQVLNNLVSNAIKFTAKGKVKLEISLKDNNNNNNMLEFCVSDTGKGIPKDHMDIIFLPFRQVEIGDTRKHGGTGLGLTISKKLVEMMGGQMSVTSSTEEPYNGSSFSITFPYRVQVRIPGQVDDASPVRKFRAESVVIEGKVLVAEDEPVSRKLVKRMLEISGYETILAEDGQKAVEQFKAHDDIALILMDVQMPNLDGLGATTLIRQLEAKTPWKKPVPIIALSAGAMKGDNERGLAVGMTDYLTKPVNFKLLQETLTTHLGARPHDAAYS